MTDTLPIERLTALANELLTVLMRCTNVEYASSILLQYQDAARAVTLTEVADMLMAADETSAALLVDRLRDGGQR